MHLLFSGLAELVWRYGLFFICFQKIRRKIHIRLGSVGPGLGDVASLDNYSLQPELSKMVFTIDMFLGRIEIFPVLVVIAMIFKRGR